MKTLAEAEPLIHVSRDLLDALKVTLHKHLPAAELILHGSTARGERGPESDCDLLAIVPAPLSPREEDTVWDALYDLQLAHGVVVSAQFCSRERWQRHPNMPFYRNVARDGILL